jgi:hypothetical protein
MNGEMNGIERLIWIAYHRLAWREFPFGVARCPKDGFHNLWFIGKRFAFEDKP